MFKIANNVQNPLQYTMPLWKVELTSYNQNFGNVTTKRGIFQRELPITSSIHNWSYPFNAYS